MKKYLLTYAAGQPYESLQRKFAKRVKFAGYFDDILMWGPKDLSSAFKQKHRRLLAEKIGAGLWVWKPYIILQALKKVPKDSIVFYCDVDFAVVGSLASYFDKAYASDIVLFHEHTALSALDCTASGTFSYMNCASDHYYARRMVLGGHNFWKSNVKAISFVREWVYWCCNENVLLPSQIDVNNIGAVISKAQDLETTQYGSRPARMHCFDQSVLTIMAEKHGIKSDLVPRNQLQQL